MSEDKTEEASEYRLEKARQEGNSGASPFFSTSVAFVVAVTLIPAAILQLVIRSKEAIKAAVARASEPEVSVSVSAFDVGWQILLIVGPLLLAVGATGAVAQLVQTGGRIATKRMLKLDNLDVVKGFKNLFSTAKVFSVARSMIAAGIVAAVGYILLRDHLIDFARLVGRPEYIGLVASKLTRSLAWSVAALGLALGAIDIVITRRQWLQSLRMSKEEKKREYKEQEGDPEVKAARKRALEEMKQQQQLAQVQKAKAVVRNPTHIACAFQFEEGDQAPKVVASGDGAFAQRILEEAERHGVPIVRDVPLARALFELEVGAEIPEALYVAVAEIIREVERGELRDKDED